MPAATGCSTIASVPPVSAPSTLKTVPIPPKSVPPRASPGPIRYCERVSAVIFRTSQFSERMCTLKLATLAAAWGGVKAVSEASKKRRRPYRLGRRAERQAETHRRIVEAAVALHGTIGPLATTVSAIAEPAGVERLTVYRHFPDQSALFAACTHHYMTLHPPPDPATWRRLTDPGDRLAAALGAMYRHFSETASVTENILRDSARSPRTVTGGMEGMASRIAGDLAHAWNASDER